VRFEKEDHNLPYLIIYHLISHLSHNLPSHYLSHNLPSHYLSHNLPSHNLSHNLPSPSIERGEGHLFYQHLTWTKSNEEERNEMVDRETDL